MSLSRHGRFIEIYSKGDTVVDIFQINAAGHTPQGDWCTCGETVTGCFWLTLALPAHQKWMSEMYERLFSQKG